MNLYSNPIDNAYSWITQEYKDFRTYPRVTKAEEFLKEGNTIEAKKLLNKTLEIDTENERAITTLVKICIQEQNEKCVEKYASKIKDINLGYFYQKKAQKAEESGDSNKAIIYAKKASKYPLKEKDMDFNKLILFKSYLKLKEHNHADKLINREKATLPQLLKWSKISSNLNEKQYAYRLVKDLPNKKEYLKWQIELLLDAKSYKEASRKIETLNKIEPSKKRKKQLLYLYALTGEDDRIVKTYQKKLQQGCDKHALEALLNIHRNHKKKRRILLEKSYPYHCLEKKKQITLSLELIEKIKHRKPKKARRIAKQIAKKIKNQEQRINLYQLLNQKSELAKIHAKTLSKSCNEYALYFLLDYHKKHKNKTKELLEKSYPYKCLSPKEQNQLSLQLITLLDNREQKKKQLIFKTLNQGSINDKETLYLSNLATTLEMYTESITYAMQYLKSHPNAPESIKNIGYAYFKLGKKSSAVHYLMEASKLKPNDYELLKNIGYLSIDLEKYKVATYYWNLYLKQQKDPKIALELASLYYYKLHQDKKAFSAIKQYEKSTKKYPIAYYLFRCLYA